MENYNREKKLKNINNKIFIAELISAVGVSLIALSLFFLVELNNDKLHTYIALTLGLVIVINSFFKLIPLWKEKAILSRLD